MALPVPAPDAAEKAARRARLQALVSSPEWDLVARGLRAHRLRAMLALAWGNALTEGEMREQQARFRLLTEILTHPVTFLAQCDTTEEGDE